MHTRRILIGALAAPVFLLSACGGDDSVADPPVSSAPTSDASTDPPQQESAEHFIRRWADADIRMQNTGSTDNFRSISVGCQDCASLADRVESIYKAGGFIRTKGWSIKRVEVVSRTGKSRLVDLHVVSKPTHYKESSGGPMKSFPGGPATYQLRIIQTGQGWTVKSLGRLS